MNQPVRRKTDADATGTNQSDVTVIFCGKLLLCPASDLRRPRSSTESRSDAGFSSLSTVKPFAGMAALRELRKAPIRRARASRADFAVAEPREIPATNERPVRGDNRTGQAIQALGVDGRSRRIQPRWGGITAPTHIGRARPAERSNRRAIFLSFWQKFWAGNSGIIG